SDGLVAEMKSRRMVRQSFSDCRACLSGRSTPPGSRPHALAEHSACSALMAHSCICRLSSACDAGCPSPSTASRTSPKPPGRAGRYGSDKPTSSGCCCCDCCCGDCVSSDPVCGACPAPLPPTPLVADCALGCCGLSASGESCPCFSSRA